MPTKARYAAQKAKRATKQVEITTDSRSEPLEEAESEVTWGNTTEAADPIDEEIGAVVLPDSPPPSFSPETEAEPDTAEPADEPGPKDYITLIRNASFGPVTINGRTTRCIKGILYYVPDVRERADILGSSRFRAATKADLVRSREPSSGPGGTITRALLPPGALKGGLQSRVRPDIDLDEEDD